MKASQRAVELVSDFLSAYFHEDWICESPSTRAVVEQYIRSSPRSSLKDLHDAIVAYVEDFSDEAELSKALFFQLGCYYRPEADGLSAREWLLAVARSLLEQV